MRLTLLCTTFLTLLNVASTAAAASSPFVQRSGQNLTLDGKVTRLVGINRYQLAGGSRADQCVYKSKNAAWISWVQQIVTQAEKLGSNVVRIWAFQNFAGPSGRDFVDLDHVVSYASKHGLKTILVLENTWADCTEGGIKDLAWFNHGYDGNYGYPLSFTHYVEAIVDHYKNDPRVAMWQIMNEGKFYQNPAVLAGFMGKIARLIKSIDKNHLVSGGAAIQCWQGNQGGVDFANFSRDPSIDVLDAHDYDEETVAWTGCMDRALKAARALNKPLLIGEAGIDSKKYSGEARAKFFAAKMQAAARRGVAGYLLWSLNVAPTYIDTMDLKPADPAAQMLSKARKEWFN